MTTNIESQAQTSDGMAKVVYILYLAGLLTGITAVIGVIIAYVNRGDAPEWLRSHYQFQIRTFWMGCLWIFIAGLLSMVFIGVLVWLAWVVWLIIRMFKGWKALSAQQAYPNPKTWIF